MIYALAGWAYTAGNRIVIVLSKIPAAPVVNQAATVVIKTVRFFAGAKLAAVYKPAVSHVLVVQSKTGIDYRDSNRAGTCGYIPGTRRGNSCSVPLRINGVVWR